MTEQSANMMPNDAPEWDARLRAPDCSTAERAAFEAWCSTRPENQAGYDGLQAMLAGLRGAKDMPEIRSLREAASYATATPAGKLSLRAWRVGLAAAVGILAVGLVVTSSDAPTVGMDRDGPSFATAVGERSTVNLADGTVTVLNTNTKIEVTYSDVERRVTLLRGQALFEVAKDPSRPFVVMVGEQRITAVGTVFDVRYEGDDVRVTLVEGIVDVRAAVPIATGTGSAMAAVQPVRMTAGQQLLTTAIATPTIPVVELADVERATIWRQGRVFFDDVPLSEAVAEMNRYSSTQIVLADSAVDVHRVNGMFRTGQQVNFIDALESYFPLSAERVAENQIVLQQKRGQ